MASGSACAAHTATQSRSRGRAGELRRCQGGRCSQAALAPAGKARHSAIERAGVGPTRDEGAIERVPPAHDEANRADRRRVLRSHGTSTSVGRVCTSIGGIVCGVDADAPATRARVRIRTCWHVQEHLKAPPHTRKAACTCHPMRHSGVPRSAAWTSLLGPRSSPSFGSTLIGWRNSARDLILLDQS